MTNADLLSELARIKALFQLRTIEAVIRGPEYPSARVHRRKVHTVASSIREAYNLPPSPALKSLRSLGVKG